MKRGLLALGVMLVLGLAIGLFLTLRADEAATPAAAAAGGPPPKDQKNAEPTPGKNRVVPPGSSAARERPSGQVDVRDHRTGGPPPDEQPPPPPVRPPDGRQIDRKITGDLSQQLRPLVAACTASVPPEAHGKTARIEGQLFVAIKAGQATVSSASFELRDVAEGVQPGLKQCLVEHIVGLSAPGGAEADVDNYPITLSMSWP